MLSDRIGAVARFFGAIVLKCMSLAWRQAGNKWSRRGKPARGLNFRLQLHNIHVQLRWTSIVHYTVFGSWVRFRFSKRYMWMCKSFSFRRVFTLSCLKYKDSWTLSTWWNVNCGSTRVGFFGKIKVRNCEGLVYEVKLLKFQKLESGSKNTLRFFVCKCRFTGHWSG
jgi:hypothetical protein